MRFTLWSRLAAMKLVSSVSSVSSRFSSKATCALSIHGLPLELLLLVVRDSVCARDTCMSPATELCIDLNKGSSRASMDADNLQKPFAQFPWFGKNILQNTMILALQGSNLRDEQMLANLSEVYMLAYFISCLQECKYIIHYCIQKDEKAHLHCSAGRESGLSVTLILCLRLGLVDACPDTNTSFSNRFPARMSEDLRENLFRRD